MELNRKVYLICLLGIFVEKAKTNIALNRPVSIGGGMCDSVVDGRYDTAAGWLALHRPAWVKIELDRHYNITKIHLHKAGTFNARGPENGTAYVLLLADKNDRPDPAKHHSCYEMTVLVNRTSAYPDEIDCSSTEASQAVALWVSANLAYRVYEFNVEDTTGQPNITLERPVTAGGGYYDFVVDGRGVFSVGINASHSPVWLKIELDQAYNISKISLSAYKREGSENDTVRLVLLEDKNDRPDPSKHDSLIVPEELLYDQFRFKEITLSSNQSCHAVALWFDQNVLILLMGIKVSDGTEILTTGSTRGPITVPRAETLDINPTTTPGPKDIITEKDIKSQAFMFGVSPTVLLGGQVLVLLCAISGH